MDLVPHGRPDTPSADSYDDPPPPVVDRDVVVVGFSYKRPVFDALASARLSSVTAVEATLMPPASGSRLDGNETHNALDALDALDGTDHHIYRLARQAAAPLIPLDFSGNAITFSVGDCRPPRLHFYQRPATALPIRASLA